VFGDILQPTHLVFILVVALLVLGPKRLPEVGRSLGKGIRDFRGALSGLDEETSDFRATVTAPLETPPPPVTPATVAADDAPHTETHPEAVATQVMATPAPVGDTMPLDRHAAESAAVDAARVTATETAAAVDAARVTATETAAHVAVEPAVEPAAGSAPGDHPLAAPGGESPASPDAAPGVK
jgi:sec-independent protein translocase protein TatA